MKKKTLKCNDCGNTKKFLREAIHLAEFSTIDEMEKREPFFQEWAGDITCYECLNNNVEEIEC